jgi:hypothetical protein
MAIVFNGAVLDWYEESVIMNDTTISSKLAPGDVYYNGTKVFGLSGTYSTVVNSGGLAPDSPTFENSTVPVLVGLIGTVFHSGSYTQGPGQDTTWTGYLAEGYKLVASDTGDHIGTASPGTEIRFFEGKTVTGINTSHNGGTTWTIYRDDGV